MGQEAFTTRAIKIYQSTKVHQKGYKNNFVRLGETSISSLEIENASVFFVRHALDLNGIFLHFPCFFYFLEEKNYRRKYLLMNFLSVNTHPDDEEPLL